MISISIQYGISESAKSNGNYKFLRITDIQDNGVEWDSVPYVCVDDNKAIGYLLCNNDIVFARTGATVGKSYLISNLIDKSVFASYLIRIKPSVLLDAHYIKLFLESPFYWEQIVDKSVGIGQPNVNGTSLGELIIPVPPILEQSRIASEAKHLFSYIDSVENDKQSLEQFVKQTKSKVLDLAIRGKLIPQDPNDEPASTLLEKIRKEQKTTKPTSDISHYPFEIPESWVWAYGYECLKPMESERPTGETFRYIDINSIDNKRHIIMDARCLNVSDAPSRASRHVEVGDILFSMVRPYLENIAYVDVDYRDCIASTGFFICRPKQILYSKYLYYLMLSPYVINGLNSFMKGDNSPSINNDNITTFLYPIPPLAEQKSIVYKIEEIIAQLENIEKALKA